MKEENSALKNMIELDEPNLDKETGRSTHAYERDVECIHGLVNTDLES